MVAVLELDVRLAAAEDLAVVDHDLPRLAGGGLAFDPDLLRRGLEQTSGAGDGGQEGYPAVGGERQAARSLDLAQEMDRDVSRRRHVDRIAGEDRDVERRVADLDQAVGRNLDLVAQAVVGPPPDVRLIPLEFADERLSTTTASEKLRSAGKGTQRLANAEATSLLR